MKRRDEPAVWREALRAASLGWDLALPIFAGVLFGHFLDRKLGTGYVFTVGLLLLGIFGGYYNVARSVRRIEARGRRARPNETRSPQRGERDETDSNRP